MIARPKVRGFFAAVALLTLLVLAWTGLAESLRQVTQRNTPPQMAQVLAELTYGISALLIIVMVFFWRRNAWIVEWLFVGSAAFAASLAAVVWGGASVLTGLITFVGAGLLAVAIVWMLRVGVPHSGRRHS